MTRIALVGDFDVRITAHRAIPLALDAAAKHSRADLEWEWVHTASIDSDPRGTLEQFDAFWCVPGSPYADAAGALAAIRFARERGRPFLGTCAGFQHAVLEYAAAHWGIAAPAHAETAPDASDPVIAPLMCALVDVADSIHFEPESRLARIYGVSSTTEEYHCRYGLNPRYEQQLISGPLRIAARDSRGGVVAIEHAEHPFFLAALFQPERAALHGRESPFVTAFAAAAVATSAFAT